ncbi:MAG: DHHA1 domain-containing protein [Candidatus Hodarchaeales archaeon]
MTNEAAFLKACQNISKDILKKSKSRPIHIFSHFDADGLAAASILAKTFFREDLTYQIRIFERLEYEALKKLGNELPKNSTIIFSDIGTGIIDAFQEWESSIEIYILDHHSPSSQIIIPKKVHLLNPHDFSIDGTSDISGAGVAYFVSINMNPKNIDLAYLAIIGALGDRQDQGLKSSLTGLNEIIVENAKKCGMVSDDVSVWFFDRSRSIISILQRASFSGLNNELVIISFLNKLKIKYKNKEKHRSFYDLNEEEFRLLASELIIQYNVDPNEIYKRDYQLTKEKNQFLQDARVFATKLNACGRSKRSDVGISLCLGNRKKALRDLNLIEKEYSKMIAQGMNWSLSNNHLEELSGIYFLDGRNRINERVIGTIISILSSRKENITKPILGCALTSTNKIKISMRTPKIHRNKFDLSYLLKQVINTFDSNFEVGGHAAAAGAIITEEYLNTFVSRVDQLVKKEL